MSVLTFLFSVRPKPRTIPMTVINKSMKTRLQTIDRRVIDMNHVKVIQITSGLVMVQYEWFPSTKTALMHVFSRSGP